MFGMGTGGSSSLGSPRSRMTTGDIDGHSESSVHGLSAMCAVEFYGQAERAISNGKLNVLPRLHIRPIKLVVFQCPSKLSLGRSHLGEGFTLICIQRLS